ncbi:MAG: fused MFS/spermidine synthase [Planctomycetaceae bacterium]
MFRSRLTVLLLALLASGVSSIINQVVWQRAIKIYLSGNDAVSSMIIVFVYMLGMGIGAWWAGRMARRIGNPLRWLAGIEVSLAGLNALVCWLLTLELHQSAQAFQRLAVAQGIPLQWLYALTASVLFAVPCVLMGMTIPLASEASQRQLRCEETRFLSQIFFLNTLGAVVGALIGSLVLLPLFGQRVSLLVAVGLNGLSGVFVLAVSFRGTSSAPLMTPSGDEDLSRDHQGAVLNQNAVGPHSGECGYGLLAGFWLGFASLAYEMYLFRLASLVFTPLPYTFAIVLTAFLLTWSLGVFHGGRTARDIPKWLARLSVSLALAMPAYFVARWGIPVGAGGMIRLQPLFVVLIAPCFAFGVLYTQLISSGAESWGKDVGRYSAYNTFGSCLGVIVATLIGFEFPPAFGLWLLIGACGALTILFRRSDPGTLSTRRYRTWLSVAAVLALLGPVLEHHNQARLSQVLYSRGGVIEIDKDRNVHLDGLWHSRLSLRNDHIGSSNWKMGVIPLLCHPGTESDLDCCVIGMGTGITAATLAHSDGVRHVDTYEINTGLAQVVRENPAGTLNVGTSSKVRILWEDARVGLALREQSYDLISQAPLYLKQAGSSSLLSKEYMELVRSRLRPEGVYCIYCNSQGRLQQAMMVLRTAKSVFRHCETFGQGYMIVASQSPIRFDAATIQHRLATDAAMRQECEQVGCERLLAYWDEHRRPSNSRFLVTDDRPLVEHPLLIRVLTMNETVGESQTR